MFVLSTTTYGQSSEECDYLHPETFFTGVFWLDNQTIGLGRIESLGENVARNHPSTYRLDTDQFSSYTPESITTIDTPVDMADLTRLARSATSENRIYTHFVAAPSNTHFIFAQDAGENAALSYVDTVTAKQIDLGIEIDADLLPLGVLWSRDEQTLMLGTGSFINVFPLYYVQIVDDTAQVQRVDALGQPSMDALRGFPYLVVLGLSADGRYLVINPGIAFPADSDQTNIIDFANHPTARHLILILDTQTDQIDILPIGVGQQFQWRDADTFILLGVEGLFQYDLDTRQIATPAIIPANFVLSPDGRYAAGVRRDPNTSAAFTEPGFYVCRTGV